MAAVDTNRGAIQLPADVSTEIMQKTQGQSAVMQLARKIALPGRGIAIPVITGDPEAAWVAETEEKPASKATLATKLIQPYTLAVIVPFSNQFKRDLEALYEAIIERLPGVLAQKFDATVMGAASGKPGDNFDTFGAITAVDLKTNPYDALVTAKTNIANAGGIMNGIALSPQGEGILLAAKDGNDRPLFIPDLSAAATGKLLGAATYTTKGAYVAGNPSGKNTVGVAGDWTQAVYGTVNGVEISISDQASLTIGGQQINLWQRNMFAVRAEIEVGFRADTTAFNLLTATA